MEDDERANPIAGGGAAFAVPATAAAAAWSLPEPRSPAGRQPTSHIVQLMTDKVRPSL